MAALDANPIVHWELTRLCDLRCHGCPTGANERRDPNELSTYEAYKNLDQIVALRPREVIITGGDPLERDDVYQIVDYARRRGLDPSLVLAPTRELTFEAIARLQANGLTTAVFSLDGSTASIHESIHRVTSSFASTLLAMRWAECTGLRLEINTLVTRRNLGDLDAIVQLIRPFGIARWNVHFLVPVGASRELEMITASEVEDVFAALEEIRTRESFAVRVVEAPHYRRFLVERLLEARAASASAEWGDFTGFVSEFDREPPGTMQEVLDAAVDGARGFVYISHAGEVRPSEFAPQSAGNLRYRPVGDIYRGSDLFVALRNPDNLRGKCGRCDYRTLCGGSRARAWAMTNDLFGADPLCAHEPKEIVA